MACSRSVRVVVVDIVVDNIVGVDTTTEGFAACTEDDAVVIVARPNAALKNSRRCCCCCLVTEEWERDCTTNVVGKMEPLPHNSATTSCSNTIR